MLQAKKPHVIKGTVNWKSNSSFQFIRNWNRPLVSNFETRLLEVVQTQENLTGSWFAADVPLTSSVHLSPFSSNSRKKSILLLKKCLLAEKIGAAGKPTPTSFSWSISNHLRVICDFNTACYMPLVISGLKWRHGMGVTSRTGSDVTNRTNAHFFHKRV